MSVRGVKSEKTNLLLARKLGSSSVFPGITGTVHIGDVQEADLRISGHAGDVEVIGGSAHGMRNELQASKRYLRTSLKGFLVFIARLLVAWWNDLSLQQSTCDGQWLGAISFDEDISLRIPWVLGVQ